jgi:hypothetical protein
VKGKATSRPTLTIRMATAEEQAAEAAKQQAEMAADIKSILAVLSDWKLKVTSIIDIPYVVSLLNLANASEVTGVTTYDLFWGPRGGSERED